MVDQPQKGKPLQWKSLGELLQSTNKTFDAFKDPKTLSGVISVITFVISSLASIAGSDYMQQLFADPKQALKNHWLLFLSLLLFFISFSFYLFYLKKRKEIKEPFPYYYTVSNFELIDTDITQQPLGKQLEKQFKYIATDLSVMLNRKIKRLTPKVDKTAADKAVVKPEKSYILIRGRYGLRGKEIEVFPSVVIYGETEKETICQPVKENIASIFEKTDQTEIAQSTIEAYEKIKEKTYFYIASLIYNQILRDVEQKISTLPTKLLKAQAYFYEAQDFLHSNTFEAYDSAISLFRKSIDYYKKIPPIFKRLRLRDVSLGRSKSCIGLSQALLFRQALANLSGKKDNPVFETLALARDAAKIAERFEPKEVTLPRYGEERSEEMKLVYETNLVLAMAYLQLGAFDKASEYLSKSTRLDYSRAMDDPLWWYVRADCGNSLESKNRLFAKVTDMDPHFEPALFSEALMEDYLLRTREIVTHEKNVKLFSEIFVERAKSKYERCIKSNPGNIRAYANLGYINWLIQDFEKAQENFEEPARYITEDASITTSALRYGLGRLHLELAIQNDLTAMDTQDHLKKSFNEYFEACSSDPNVASCEYEYYYEYFNDNLLKRYDDVYSQFAKLMETPQSNFMVSVAPYCYNDLANAYYNHYYFKGDIFSLNTAIAYYNKAIKSKPDFGPAYLNLAKAYDWMDSYGKIDEIVLCALKANDLEPNWPEARNYCIDKLIELLAYLEREPDIISNLKMNEICAILSRTISQGDFENIRDQISIWINQKIQKTLEDLKQDFMTGDLSVIASSISKKMSDEIILQKRHLDALLLWLKYQKDVKKTEAKEIGNFYENLLKNYLPGYYPIHKVLLDLYLKQSRAEGIEPRLGKLRRQDQVAQAARKVSGITLSRKDTQPSLEILTEEDEENIKQSKSPEELVKLAEAHDEAYESYCNYFSGLSKFAFAWLSFLANSYREYGKELEAHKYITKIRETYEDLFNEAKLPPFYYFDLASLKTNEDRDTLLQSYFNPAKSVIEMVNITEKTKGTIYNRFGNLFFDKNLYEEAVLCYNKAITNDKDRPIYECSLGRAYGKLRLSAKMVEHCLKAVELRKKTKNDAYELSYYYDFLSEAYFNDSRLKEFEDLFEASGDLKDDPGKKAVIYNRIGNLFAEGNKAQDAILYYEKAIGLDSKMPIYECNLGLMCGNLGQWEKAIEHHNRAVNMRRNTPTDSYGLDYYYGFLAEAYFKAGRLKAFEVLLEASGDLKNNPGKKAVIYNRIGNLFSAAGQIQEAIPFYEKAIELDKTGPIYEFNLGLMYRNLERLEKAIEYFSRAVELRRNTSTDFYGLDYYTGFLVEAYFKVGRLKEFEELFEASGDLKDEQEKKAVIYNRMGNLLAEGNKAQDAILYYEKAIGLDSKISIYECNLGLTYGDLGQLEKAIEHHKRAVELRRNASSDAYGLDYYTGFLMEAYFKVGRLKEFEELFEASGDLKDEQEKKAVIYNRMGNLLAEGNKAQDAILYYEKAIGLDSKIPIYECNLGLALEKLDQLEKAIEHYTRAVDLRRNTPTDAYGLDYYTGFLVEAYFKVGRLKEFEELFEASGDLKDEQEKKAVIYNRMGNLFSAAGQFQEAIPFYEKAIELDKTGPIYEFNLGLMYRNLEQLEKAIEHFTRAVELRRNRVTDSYDLDYYNGFLAEVYFKAGKDQEAEELLKRVRSN